MTRLKSYINELSLKRNAEIRVKTSTSSGKVYEISFDNHLFTLEIFQGKIKTNFYNKFVLKKPEVFTNPEKFIKEWEIEFFDEEHEMDQNPKGSKVALTLFAAIEKILTKFIIENDPMALSFDPSDESPSRKKLYKTLANKIERKWPEYVKLETGDEGWLLIKRKQLKKYEN